MENFTTIHYQINGKEIDIYLMNDDKQIWLSQMGIAILFESSYKAVGFHINSILKECKYDYPTRKEIFPVRTENGRKVRRKINIYHKEIIEEIGRRKRLNSFEQVKEFVSNYLNLNEQKRLDENEIIIFDNGRVHVSVEISKREQTIWATESQIADAFEVSRQTINYHINNILKDNELEPISVRKEILHTGSDGKQYLTVFYNLDMVLAIGYRVNSKIAIKFRRWATEILSDVIKQGYAINEERCIVCKDAIIGLQNRVLQLENNQNKEVTFYPGYELKSFAAIERFLKSAKQEIIIVDNYFGHDFDSVLSEINVEKIVITNPKNSKIETNENYKVIKANEFHDRYIIVDDVGFFFGQSFGQLGSKLSESKRMQDKILIDAIKSFKYR